MNVKTSLCTKSKTPLQAYLKGGLMVALFCWVLQGYGQYAAQVKVEHLLKADTNSIGQRIVYPQFNRAEVSMLKITMEPGTVTGWHKHAIPLFAYIVQGVLTVERESGDQKEFKAGMAVAEMYDTYHQGINRGNEPVVLIAVYLGGDGIPLSERLVESEKRVAEAMPATK